MDSDAGRHGPAGLCGETAQIWICGEVVQIASGPEGGDKARRKTQRGEIYVVLHGIRTDHYVAYVDVVIQRAGDACIQQMCDLKAVDQDLGTEGGIYLSDTAFDDDNVCIPYFSDMKEKPGF